MPKKLTASVRIRPFPHGRLRFVVIIYQPFSKVGQLKRVRLHLPSDDDRESVREITSDRGFRRDLDNGKEA